MADELTYRASRSKAAFVLLASIAFVAIGYFMRLDTEGLEMGSFVKKTRIKWTDVAGFELASIRGARMIAIIYAPHYEAQKTLNEWQARYSRTA